MYSILKLNLDWPITLMSNFISCTISNTCKFYLVPHRTILVNWQQSYRSFSEELDFSDSKFYEIKVLLSVHQHFRRLDRQLWDILYCACAEHDIDFRWKLNRSFSGKFKVILLNLLKFKI